jgi:hypothetical protein
MEHAREPIIHLLRELVTLLGMTGAEILVCIMAVIVVAGLGLVVLLLYLILRFGESSLREVLGFVLQAFNTFKYQTSQRTSPAIRVELYFDCFLGILLFISLGGLIAHAIVPWVTERAESLLFAAFISALVVFSFLAYVSMRMSVRVRHG